MADEHDSGDKEHEEQASAKTKNKHDWAAADLEKVTDFHDDADNGKEVSNTQLHSLMNGPQATSKTVNIRREDVQLIVDELELPRVRAEKALIEHDGNVMAATKALLGF